MADFAGFNIETPQEVLQRLNEQRKPLLLSNDVNTRNFALFDAVLQNAFGNPEVEKAEQREEAAKAAFSSIQQKEGEDDLAFRQRQTQVFFDRVKNVDPALAAQASEQLTAIQNERIERNLLKSREARAEKDFAIREEQHEVNQRSSERKQALGDIQYAVNRETGEVEAYNLSDATSKAEWMRAARDPVNQMYTRDEMVALDRKKAGASEWKLFNNSSFQNQRDIVSAKTDATNRMERMLEILDTDLNARTGVAKAQGMINSFAVEFGAVNDKLEDMEMGRYDAELQKVNKFGGISEAARNRGVTDALVLDLAYTMARAKDPGGRLSDKDVEAALKMLGGDQVDPAILARTFLEQNQASVAEQLASFAPLTDEEAFRNSTQGRILMDEHERLSGSNDKLINRAAQFLPQAEVDNIVFDIPMPGRAVPAQVVAPDMREPAPTTAPAQAAPPAGNFTLRGL